MGSPYGKYNALERKMLSLGKESKNPGVLPGLD
jgi:hypothetical protein